MPWSIQSSSHLLVTLTGFIKHRTPQILSEALPLGCWQRYLFRGALSASFGTILRFSLLFPKMTAFLCHTETHPLSPLNLVHSSDSKPSQLAFQNTLASPTQSSDAHMPFP